MLTRYGIGRLTRTVVALSTATALTIGGTAMASAALPKVTGPTLAGTAKPTSAKYTALNGGVTDGTYWYAVVSEHAKSGSKVYDSTQLIKTKLYASSPTKVATFRIRSGNHTNLLGHGNDMAYNADTKRLMIPAWTNDNSVQASTQGRSVRVVNPSTLAIEKTVLLPHTTTGLCYDAVKNRYVGGTLNQYYAYDSAFKETGKSAKLTMPGTGQGIDCDQSYIYVITSPKGTQKTNKIFVYNWSFKLVRTYEHASSAESEHLTHQRGTYYLGFNTGAGRLYRLDNFQFTVTYAAAGGTGSMPSTVVLYGRTTALQQNAFKRSGYTFTGWTAKRSYDNKTRYYNPKDTSKTGWYAAGKQPSGWKPYLYKNGATVLHTTPRGAVALTATWRKA
ncbi:InlB B-repeat-containing protein [Kribbella sp. NPDC051587]|uniref:InlB B-repeat-containing protein n=1 Tax=Kribbella sp. NPDC051587 TaxID=3364119 RepID=UPI0037B4B275